MSTLANMRPWTAALAVLLLASAPAFAADPLLDEGFAASLGTFALDSKTVVRVDGTSGNGDEVNVEEELGLAEKDSLRLDMHWRFSDKHKLRAMWFDNNRSATRVLAQDITVGDTTYLAGSSVSTKLDTQILELAYEYAFWREPNWEITGSAGLHTLMMEYDVDGAVDTAPEADVTGPLPVFGAHGIFKFGSNWYLDAQAQFFAIEIGEFSGSLNDYKASLTYMFGENFGIGGGWNRFTMRFESTQPDFEGVMRWRYGGPMLFVTAAF